MLLTIPSNNTVDRIIDSTVVEGLGHKNMIFRNFSELFLGCLPPVNSLTRFQKRYFRPQKKGASPPKWTKSAHFLIFGLFYMIFGSVWPSKRTPRQIFVSNNLYLGHKKPWCDWQVKKGGLYPKISKKLSFFPLFRSFYTVFDCFRPSKRAWYQFFLCQWRSIPVIKSHNTNVEKYIAPFLSIPPFLAFFVFLSFCVRT